MCSGSEAASYLRLIDSCITQLKAQGTSRTCNESKAEEEEKFSGALGPPHESTEANIIKGTFRGLYYERDAQPSQMAAS